jgi:hypothetical protein
MIKRNGIKTSPYPLQRGTTSPPTPLQKRGERCPPLEGAGGGKECVIVKNETIHIESIIKN